MIASVEISAETIAVEMQNHGEFAMDILAELADREADALPEIAAGNSGSSFHERVPAFLRRLADAIDAKAK